MSQVLVEQPLDRHIERVRDRDDHIERRIASSVLNAGQVRAVDARALSDVALKQPGALTQVANTTSEPHARGLTSVHDFSRHAKHPMAAFPTEPPRRLHA